MSIDQAFNYKAINESVATAGLLSEEQLAELGSTGYHTVINLLPHDSEYAIPSEHSIVTSQGLDYVSIPVDFADPQEQDYALFAEALRACEDKKVLIHCAANYRVSAFYAMYAHEHLGWSAEHARQHIESIWSPEDYPPWAQFIASRIPGGG